eukprot:SAG31_NODE_739_length_12444_cov_14.976831_8_plen_89_part_00
MQRHDTAQVETPGLFRTGPSILGEELSLINGNDLIAVRSDDADLKWATVEPPVLHLCLADPSYDKQCHRTIAAQWATDRRYSRRERPL